VGQGEASVDNKSGDEKRNYFYHLHLESNGHSGLVVRIAGAPASQREDSVKTALFESLFWG
jgi:hypothetical protein